MIFIPEGGPEHRVLVMTTTGNDAALAHAVLARSRVHTAICRDAEELRREVAAGAGSILVAEEAMTPETRSALDEMMSRQPEWSDLPVLVLTRPGADSATVLAAMASLGNVTLLERPVRVPTLVSAVLVALRARTRQYDLRARLEARQKRAREELRTSEERFRSLVSVITDVPWTADAGGHFVQPQPAWAAYTGQTWDEQRGQGWIDAIHPDDRGHILATWSEALQTPDLYEAHGRLWNAPTREYRHFVVRATPLLNDDGSVREWVGTCTDVHERRRAEEALRDADRRKDEFLATLAHELRNPLAPIRNSLHILGMTTSNPAIEYVRQMMERQVNQMVRLVDDLMEVSRITRGKIDLRKEPVELSAVVQSAVETSQPAVDAGGHRLELLVPDEPLVVEADPVRLAQVFSNLLNNAAKYSEKASQITLTARREGSTAVVSVRDRGAGIAREMLPRVFDMFTQIDGSRRKSQGGLGIGLTIARNLVEMHGGTIAAHSEGPGLGSEFTVRLPLAQGVPSAGGVHRGRPAGSLPLRILVVDDNRDAADSLAMMLRFLGAEVHLAYDGRTALSSVEQFRPDLVLLDIGMPGMDGYEVARRIRHDPDRRGVTIIALTGWGQQEDMRRTREAGFDHHLIKPAGIDALQALMTSVVKNEHDRPLQTKSSNGA